LFEPVGGMGIWLWNRHQAVAWASGCGMGIRLWHGHQAVAWASGCGMGIRLWHGHQAVEWASGCGMGILPVSISGQARLIAIARAVRT
ncbi:hypothetical protein, partial [Moorena sp. SIO3B2]